MGEKPTAAFVLSLVGGMFYLLVGLIVAAASALIGGIASLAGYASYGGAIAAVGGIGLVCGILMVVGAVMMNSSSKSRVRLAAIIVLVFTLVGAIFTAGGFVIGFILALIGSILGLTWNPSSQMPPSPMPAASPPP